jgi:formate hydrogenlyase subunit 3/multisubunit Na+/H+ antiporter MnhD subunit
MAEDRGAAREAGQVNQLVLTGVLAPMLIGLVLLVARRIGRGLRQAVAVFGSLLTLGTLITLWALVGAHGATFDFGALFGLDNVGLLLATVFAGIWVIVSVYSIEYIRGLEPQDDYCGFLLLMLGGMVGLCLTRSLVGLYAFWEIVGITTWRLTAFYRRDAEVEIANRTLLVTFAGSVLMLVGLAALFARYGVLDWQGLAGVRLEPWIAVLILGGMVTKSASLPLYVWLPDAHSAAPSPVSAVLSGVVAKAGLIAYIKLFIQGRPVLAWWWPWLVGGLGVAGALIAGGCALRERDIKRVLAFSTVSQLGYVFIGFALASSLGLLAGLVYLIGHAIAKAGLFLAYGVVEHSTRTRDLRELRGLGPMMPVTAVSAALLMLSIVGIPPLLGFFGKFYVLRAAVETSFIVAVGAIVAAVLTLLYMLRLYQAFVGSPGTAQARREGWLMAACVAQLAVASSGLGLFYPVLAAVLERGLGS